MKTLRRVGTVFPGNTKWVSSAWYPRVPGNLQSHCKYRSGKFLRYSRRVTYIIPRKSSYTGGDPGSSIPIIVLMTGDIIENIGDLPPKIGKIRKSRIIKP